MATTLVKFDRARQALAEARTVDEVKDVRDKAEAIRLYARQQGESREIQNDIAEIKLRAERRLGELLAEMEKAKGAADGTPGPGRGKTRSHDVTTFSQTPTLSDIGISKMQSSRWQRAAQIPDEAFEVYVAKVKAAPDSELTSASVQRLAKKLRLQEERAQTAANTLINLPEGKYRCIVVDPPWPMQKIVREVRPNQDRFDYRTMTIEEIAKLPIGELADEGGCHVYLWTTHKYLPTAFDLFSHWKVKYQCLMTWVKPTGMTPFSWMYNTELVLFGRIGSLKLDRLGLKLSFSAPATRHSEKPETFYERVRLASPLPRLEVFARELREGFEAWGDEV